MGATPLELSSALILMAVGIVAGFLNVVGGGGSLLTLPVLIFMGLPPNVANATNRVAIFWQNVFAIRKFRKAGLVEARYSIYLGLAAVPGAVIGGLLAVEINGELFTRILSVIMLVVGVMIVLESAKGQKASTEKKNKNVWKGILTFFLIGIYGGFIHAGVGFIIILVLTWLTSESLARINSIKVIVAFVYTAVVILVFLIEDIIDWEYGLTLAVGTSIGGWLGSYFSIKKGDKWIRVLLFLTIVVLSIKLWFYH